MYECITLFIKIIVALYDLAMDDAIQAFIHGLKPYLTGFIETQIQVITDTSLNKVIKARLKLKENMFCGF